MAGLIIPARDPGIDERADDRQLLTTADVARMVERTPRGVRWLVHSGVLPCETTAGGQHLYRLADVRRLLAARAMARLTGVAVLRPKKINPPGAPYQLALGPVRLPRASQGSSCTDPEVRDAETLSKPPWS